MQNYLFCLFVFFYFVSRRILWFNLTLQSLHLSKKKSNVKTGQYSSLVADTLAAKTYFQPDPKQLGESNRNVHNENSQNETPHVM